MVRRRGSNRSTLVQELKKSEAARPTHWSAVESRKPQVSVFCRPFTDAFMYAVRFYTVSLSASLVQALPSLSWPVTSIVMKISNDHQCVCRIDRGSIA